MQTLLLNCTYCDYEVVPGILCFEVRLSNAKMKPLALPFVKYGGSLRECLWMHVEHVIVDSDPFNILNWEYLFYCALLLLHIFDDSRWFFFCLCLLFCFQLADYFPQAKLTKSVFSSVLLHCNVSSESKIWMEDLLAQ